jgi:hypothetical protein
MTQPKNPQQSSPQQQLGAGGLKAQLQAIGMADTDIQSFDVAVLEARGLDLNKILGFVFQLIALLKDTFGEGPPDAMVGVPPQEMEKLKAAGVPPDMAAMGGAKLVSIIKKILAFLNSGVLDLIPVGDAGAAPKGQQVGAKQAK